MTHTIKQIIVSAAMLATIIFFVGCTAIHPKKVISGNSYDFTFQDATDYTISNVYVTSEGNTYKIRGSLANRWSPEKINSGKVKLIFVDSNGNVHKEFFVPIHFNTSKRSRCCQARPYTPQVHFRAKVTKELLDNNSIKIEYLRE